VRHITYNESEQKGSGDSLKGFRDGRAAICVQAEGVIVFCHSSLLPDRTAPLPLRAVNGSCSEVDMSQNQHQEDPNELKSKLIFIVLAFGGMIVAKLVFNL
jgi:hypothetical protein